MKKTIVAAILILLLPVCSSCEKPAETPKATEAVKTETEETPTLEVTPEITEEPTPSPTPRPVYNGQWSNLYGGRIRDIANRAIINSDGDYVLVGNTNSDDSFITDTNKNPAAGDWGEPTQDVLILKLDVNGEVLQKDAHGGVGIEYASDIEQTPDGGYIITGRSTSDDEPFSVNHGIFDMFIMKVDLDFALLWVTTIGGSGNDEAWDVEVMEDGSYLVAGYTTSRDGDITEGYGYDNADCLLANLDDDGNIVWLKTFGGNDTDVINRLCKTSDGGWIASGYTNSTDGEFTDTGIHEGSKTVAFQSVQTEDALAVKLDSKGQIVWARCVGGKRDDTAYYIAQTADGGYILTGETISGDVKGYHSQKDDQGVYITDMLAAKLDADGNEVWTRAFGGKRRDTGAAVAAGANCIIIIGETRSEDGDVKGYHEGHSSFNSSLYLPDMWITALDYEGSLLGSGCIGGTDMEYASDVMCLADGGFMIMCSTNSNDGDMESLEHAYVGYPDIFVFRSDPGWMPGQ